MRILQVIETGGGGSGRHYLDLIAGLSARGHDVTAVYSPVRAEPGFVADLSRLPGIEVHAVPMRRAVTPRDLGDYLSLLRLLRRLDRFEIAHGHSSKAGALVRLLPRSVASRRIYTPHALRTMDPTLGRVGRLVYGTFEKVLAPRTDALVAVSVEEAEHAKSLSSRLEPQVIVNGITAPAFLDRATARARLDLPADGLVAGFVGRLSRQKDPVRFVRAVSKAAERVPGLSGVVIGDGDLGEEVRQAARKGDIRLAGWQHEAVTLLPAFDLFVMTSRYEAMPYALIEALHAGLPILTTDVGGAEATVLPGANGAIVPVDASAEKLADEIVGLVSDSESRERMSASSEGHSQHFTRDVMVGKTESLYRATLRSGGFPRR